MFRWMRALWYKFTGIFGFKTERLYEDAAVQAAVYDRSIAKDQDRFRTVKNAVAELMRLEQTRINEIKELHTRETKLNQIVAGAQAAMQRRVNELQTTLTKEQILVDPEFIKHKAAYADNRSTLAEVEKRISEKEEDLKGRQQQIATFEVELRSMQSKVKSKIEAKAETIAETAIAKQSEEIDAVLSGIQSDTADEDLVAVNAARDRAKARSKLVGKLAGNDAAVVEQQYLELANATTADKELDGLLNWGAAAPKKEEAAPEAMQNAKLPE